MPGVQTPNNCRTAARGALLLCTASLLLAGCGGWQLRGAGPRASAPVSTGYLILEDSPGLQDVTRVLERAGLRPAAAVEGGNVVEIHSLRESRRTVSLTERSRSAEYELISTLRYRIVAPDGRELVPLTPVSEQRDYAVDRDNIMGSSSEEEQLREEMRGQLATAVTRALTAIGRSP